MNLLSKENVQLLSSAVDWKDAIRLSVKSLELGGFVKHHYSEEIISNVESMGAYIVIAPGIALPHARPEQGVKKSQIAITLLKKGVLFPEKEIPVRLLIALAAADNNSHLDALVTISEVLQDEDQVQKLFDAKTETELFHYFD